MVIQVKNKIDEILNESFLESNNGNVKELLQNLSQDKECAKIYLAINNLQYPQYIPDTSLDEYLTETKKLIEGIDFKRFKKLGKNIDLQSTFIQKQIEVYLFENKNAINFSEYLIAEKEIKKHIVEQNKILSESVLNPLSQEERKQVEEFSENPDVLIEAVKKDCLNILNEKLRENDLDKETKLLIYETKDKINESKNVIDLLILKNSLLEE